MWIASIVVVGFLLDWMDWPSDPLHRRFWSIPLGSLVVFWFSTLSKPRSRKTCNILLLRGFEQERRRRLYQRVFPVLGCYGRLIALRNPDEEPKKEVVGAASSAFLTDVHEHAVARGKWRDKVLELLLDSDLVVIDVTELSDPVRWELGASLRSLPPDRILVICEFTSRRYENIEAAMAMYFEHGVPLEKCEFAVYFTWRTWPIKFWKAWPLKFERQIAAYMKSVRSLTWHVERGDG